LLASQADGDLLLAALKQYVLGHLSLHSGGIKQEAPSLWLRPFYDNGIENPGLKKETSQSRPVKTGSSPVASAKEPLTSLSSLIADALQVVDQDHGLNRGLNRDRGPGLRDLEGEHSDSSLEASRAEKDKTMLQNVPTLNPNPQENTPLALAALKVRSRYDISAEAPGGRQVGLENVQSRTSEAGVAVQKKDTTQSVEEVAEVAGWIKEVVPPPASLVYEESHKKTMHAPELQLDVKADSKRPNDDIFGYVITDTE
ncbi:hypothetical protein XENOCAPTIV_022910, partial [Xenoophorus captivus]